jgi:hypothetical protein
VDAGDLDTVEDQLDAIASWREWLAPDRFDRRQVTLIGRSGIKAGAEAALAIPASS